MEEYNSSEIRLIFLYLVYPLLRNGLANKLLTFGAPLGEYVLGGMNKVLPSKMKFIKIDGL